jgi:ceramide glucosyltransferase
MIAAVCLIWWAVCVSVLIGSVVLALAQPAIRRRGMVATRPAVSVIVPVKDPEPDFRAGLAGVLRQTRPGDEVMITAAETDSAVLRLAREVLGAHPSVPARIFTGAARVTVSPKLSGLIAPMAAARNDIILIKDSNITLEDGQLDALVRHLAPGVGMVTVATRADGARSFGARVEAAVMNGYQARLVLAASALGAGFGLGKISVFSRAAYARTGGVMEIADRVGEDNAMGKQFARLGLSTVIAGTVVRQVLGARGIGAVWQRQLRWMICRRCDEVAAFAMEPFFTASAAVLAAALAAPALGLASAWLAGGTALGWFALENLFLALKRWPLVSPASWVTREVMIPAMWCAAWTTTEVVWAGQRLDVRRGVALP